MFVAKNIPTDHKDLIHDVAYDFYGKRMATCSSDQSVKVTTVWWALFRISHCLCIADVHANGRPANLKHRKILRFPWKQKLMHAIKWIYMCTYCCKQPKKKPWVSHWELAGLYKLNGTLSFETALRLKLSLSPFKTLKNSLWALHASPCLDGIMVDNPSTYNNVHVLEAMTN